ncbi:YceI family protein [Variovorax paradoxus]|nr:YceI family protein [Variovorax paradoxus]
MGMLRPAHIAALLALLIAACAPQIRETAPEPKPVAGRVPEGFPRSDYEQAAAQGKPVYRIDPARSLVAITVRRGGSLAHLGHDHVVASHGARGYIAPEEGRADLYIPLDELSVDAPALRAQAALDTQPSASDIAGTRVNMLDKVLETRQFPFALIHVSRLEKVPMGARLAVAITLHGVTRTMEVPAQIETERGETSVTGSLQFDQSEFGIVPFSILGGAIQVQDRLSLRFSIRARHGDGLMPWSAQ